jgi:O-antigen/teichoic acid export membrane protein
MKLLKTSFYTSISTAVTFMSGFIVTKFVAVKIGPEGMSYVGQYQNTIAILAMFSTLAVTTGVVKYLAEHKDDDQKRQQVISTALIIIIFSSLIISSFVFFAKGFLSNQAFKDNSFADVFFLYGFFVSIIALNTLIASVYNGLKEIRYLTAINISGSLAGICFTVFFAYKMGVKGVLIANNFTALLMFIINLVILKKKNFFRFKPAVSNWHNGTAKLLLGFTAIGVVSGLLSPFSQILVRSRIISSFSTNEAGWWQAITRISDYYLAFITTVLSIYYLPRLSEIKSKKELKQEILKGYKIILPIVGAMAFTIWLCRVWIVHILFSKAFLPMTPLFTFQLLGDFFKIGSWLLGYVLIAKADIKIFIITEVLFTASLVLLSYFFMSNYGITGTTYAFCMNYAAFWIAMILVTRKYFTDGK